MTRLDEIKARCERATIAAEVMIRSLSGGSHSETQAYVYHEYFEKYEK